MYINMDLLKMSPIFPYYYTLYPNIPLEDNQDLCFLFHFLITLLWRSERIAMIYILFLLLIIPIILFLIKTLSLY